MANWVGKNFTCLAPLRRFKQLKSGRAKIDENFGWGETRTSLKLPPVTSRMFRTCELPQCRLLWSDCLLACSHSQEVGGLALTSARFLVRGHVDESGLQLADAEDHTSCVPCSHAHCGRDHRMCVFVKRRSSLQRLAHATGDGLRRLHIWALRSLGLTSFESENHDISP